MFTFQDGGIYQNRVKICTGVTNCKFSTRMQEEKQMVSVIIEIGQNEPLAKNIEYVMGYAPEFSSSDLEEDYGGILTEEEHIHSYGNWTSVNDSIHRGTCSCGETKDEQHSYGDYVVTKAATHTDEGIETATCDVCGSTKTRTIAAIGHSYGNWVKVNDQIHRRTCSCGAYEDKNHTWSSWVTTKAATHSNTGTQTATCTVCNTTKTQTIAALGHNASCYSTACRGSFALSSTTSQTYYTCSHTHTYPGGNRVDGSSIGDDATYTVSGACYTKAITYKCPGIKQIVRCKEYDTTSIRSSCCNAICYIGKVFEVKCNNANCGKTTEFDYTATTLWYCSKCLRYISSSTGQASNSYLHQLSTAGTCNRTLTKYGLSCGYHSGTQNFTRSIQTYKCATCGKTTNLNLAASKTCSICGKTHAVSQSGSKTATHNTVPKYLICGQ